MSQKKRILLIDNEAGLCRMMEQVLLDNGYLAKAFTDPGKRWRSSCPTHGIW